MKVKLDENIPHRLARELSTLGHKVDTVLGEGLAGSDDYRVWEAARKNVEFLVTQDTGFSKIAKFSSGAHPGILLVRLRDPGRAALFDHILHLFKTEDVENWSHCIVVSTDRKLRIRNLTK